MNFKPIFFCFLFLLGCNSNVKQETSTTNDFEEPEQNTTDFINPDSFPESTRSFTEINIEERYISLDSVFLNGKLPFLGNKDLFLESLGKPDSINKRGYDCGSFEIEDDEKEKIYYYGLSQFEVTTNKYCIRRLDFLTGNFYLKFRDINFDKNYSLSDFSKDFSYELPPQELEYEEIELWIYEVPNASDLFWRFYFKNDLLYQIWYFVPC